jgi:hypothetical protein
MALDDSVAFEEEVSQDNLPGNLLSNYYSKQEIHKHFGIEYVEEGLQESTWK